MTLTVCGYLPNRTVGNVKAPTTKCFSHLPQCAVGQFTFYRLPKALITDERFKDMSNNAKLLYGLMLDRMSLSKRRGWLDEDNKVFIKYSLADFYQFIFYKS